MGDVLGGRSFVALAVVFPNPLARGVRVEYPMG